MFFIVYIENYKIVGSRNTMHEVYTAYKSAFYSSENKINADSKSAKKVIESVVVRIQNDVKNGNSFYYFTVKDYPNIFVGSSQISNQLPITAVGDNVKISFDLDNEEIIDVSTFENVSLTK